MPGQDPRVPAVHDLGTNFNSATFRSYLKSISNTLKQMLIKAYHSVGLVERYYVLVRRAFKIVTKELLKALKEDRLQIAIKAINDTARPNSLRATAINKAIKEVRKCHAAKQVKDALKKKNGLITKHTLDLLISSRVLSTSIKPYYFEVEKLPKELQVPKVKVKEKVEKEVEDNQSESEKELEIRNSLKP
ncbi:hypothetical protein MBM_00705 [Drepanopeziza brunnea f. sp. 'multigermtubi' MB_m1]|uniref:Polyprotein n=1 Tax=Marssonina brunnea f. sp. multigermtubi (strain MB_m1) TaxID=1072389 RepID=K1X9B2_MARBU|nr:uncharacterized protein MBM_00705 [Drepanopeziza brunnea f. sp. 'multigermtubi' MB_m1]EKD21592.1 hypothetical protein MBM_00705 [Drepanopeziza brunnea f. sp. 'multigermtubi' MB_m1]